MDDIPHNSVPAADAGRGRPAKQRPAPRQIRPDAPSRLVPAHAPDRPWWFDAPKVFLGCAHIAFLPVTAVIRAAEVAVACAVLGIVGVGAAWWFGGLSDAEIVATLQPVGQRLLAMVQSAANR